MKKNTYLLLIVSLLASVPFLAFARGFQNHHHRMPTPPPPIIMPTSTPPVPLGSLQWGVFPNDAPFSPTLPWTMVFTQSAFPSTSGNLVVFIEPQYTDAQIVAGQFDTQLKSFAAAAANHSGKVMLALGEEVNCDNSDPWGGAYRGNTVASTIAAFQHEVTIARAGDPNIIIAFSDNNDSCYNQPPGAIYYPGSAYVDVIGVDGFSFPATPQNWDAVFDHAIVPLQAFHKPIWVLSEGSAQNQSQFITDSFSGAKTYDLAGIMYFNQTPFALGSVALSTLASGVK